MKPVTAIVKPFKLDVARGDVRAAAGLLDAARSSWRTSATSRLADLRRLAEKRWAASGEVAHLLEPDSRRAGAGCVTWSRCGRWPRPRWSTCTGGTYAPRTPSCSTSATRCTWSPAGRWTGSCSRTRNPWPAGWESLVGQPAPAALERSGADVRSAGSPPSVATWSTPFALVAPVDRPRVEQEVLAAAAGLT